MYIRIFTDLVIFETVIVSSAFYQYLDFYVS